MITNSCFSQAYLETQLDKEKNAQPGLQDKWQKSSNNLWGTLYKSNCKQIPELDKINKVFKSTGSALNANRARIDYLIDQIDKKNLMVKPIKRVCYFICKFFICYFYFIIILASSQCIRRIY